MTQESSGSSTKRVRSFFKKINIFRRSSASKKDASHDTEVAAEPELVRMRKAFSERVQRTQPNAGSATSQPLPLSSLSNKQSMAEIGSKQTANTTTPSRRQTTGFEGGGLGKLYSSSNKSTSALPTSYSRRSSILMHPIPILDETSVSSSSSSTTVSVNSSSQKQHNMTITDNNDNNNNNNNNVKHQKRVSLLQPYSYYRQTLISNPQELETMDEDTAEESGDETLHSNSASSSTKQMVHMGHSKSERPRSKSCRVVSDLAPIAVPAAIDPDSRSSSTSSSQSSKRRSKRQSRQGEWMSQQQKPLAAMASQQLQILPQNYDPRRLSQMHMQFPNQPTVYSYPHPPYRNPNSMHQSYHQLPMKHQQQYQQQRMNNRLSNHRQSLLMAQAPQFYTKQQHQQSSNHYRTSFYGLNIASKSETVIPRNRLSRIHTGMVIPPPAHNYHLQRQQQQY